MMQGMLPHLHDAKGLVPLQQRQGGVVQAAEQVLHHLVHRVLVPCTHTLNQSPLNTLIALPRNSKAASHDSRATHTPWSPTPLMT